jgi:predicted dehydrogenase
MGRDMTMDRRRFVAASALAAAGVSVLGASGRRVLGANDAIRVGCIGVGIRGFGALLSPMLKFEDVRVVAIADSYTGWLQRAVSRAKDQGHDPKPYGTYRQLLDDKNVEVVVCATPEHSHARVILDTLASGRDIFCEKPMVHTWQQALAVLKANEQAKRIIQIGTQRRSSDIYPVAREIIQSGKIGQVTQVRAWWNRNSVPTTPQWRYPIPDDASPETCNWPEFLCGAPKRPFARERYFQWRCYFDYSGGIGGDLMVHQIDAINMVMGSQWPLAAYGRGHVYRWKELGRETPDTWSAAIEHPAGVAPAAPDGFMVHYSSSFSNVHYDYQEQYLGADGALEMNDRSLKVFAEPKGLRSKEVEEITFDSKTNHTVDHLRNFFDCCRSRKPTNCTPTDGAYAAVAANMTILSHFSGHRVEWDAEKMCVKK